MATTTTTLRQDILPGSGFPQSITVTRTTPIHADEAIAKLLTSSDVSPAIGIAYHISKRGKVDFICLATCSGACLIKFAKPGQVSAKGTLASLLASNGKSIQLTEKSSGTANTTFLVGFQMARIAVQVNHVTKQAVRGVDLQRLFPPGARDSPADIVNRRLTSAADSWKVSRLWIGEDESVGRDLPLQAWLAACIGLRHKDKLARSHLVDTDHLHFLDRCCLGSLVSQVDFLERNKPRESINDFSKAAHDKAGNFQVENSRFTTRVRNSKQTQVVVEDANGTQFTSSAMRVKGKQTTLRFHKDRPSHAVSHIKVLGREEATSSERASDELLFGVLAGLEKLPRSTLIKKIWFHQRPSSWSGPRLPTPKSSVFEDVIKTVTLNDSQTQAARAMVGESQIVVVHGPPGTGKTTTIAVSALVWDHSKHPAWIVAHSNVAVKNIAESFAKKGVDFKLLVSKEFYEEWHEHLYEGVVDRLIQSDQLSDVHVDINRLIMGSCVVLSTLSMLSNPVLHQCGAFALVPLERLVIDEASQINIFEFLHVFHSHHKTLQKVCFFGDPFQLPPFGKEEVHSIQTIFDLEHVMKSAKTVFLDTQYRMPTPIGSFISQNVYQGRLKSVHGSHTPGCLAFIDATGKGEEKKGKSTRNTGEVNVIVSLVRFYYSHTNFCIITPYDAQRSAIQDALKREGLPWEQVFNLDSFQGNEADFVLVSVVRSAQPGFLSSLNRMNVMLTRCKKGMVIVSNKGFLGKGGSGRSTLLGKLLDHWTTQHHAGSQPWVDWRSASQGSVDLPGVPAPKPSGLLRQTATISVSRSLTDGMGALTISSTSPSIPSSQLRRPVMLQPSPTASGSQANSIPSASSSQPTPSHQPSKSTVSKKAKTKIGKKALGHELQLDGANR